MIPGDNRNSANVSAGSGYLYVLVSAALFGLMPLFTKLAYRYGSDPYTVSFMRFFYTVVVSGLCLKTMPGGGFAVTRRQLKWLAFIALIYATIPLLLYGSYTRIDSTLASALHFSYPVFVMILSVVILHTKPDRRQVICAAICMAGVALLTQTSGESGSLTGGVMALLSGVSYALYVICLTKSGINSIPMLTMVFWLSLFTGLYLLVFTLATGNLQIVLPFRAHLAHFGLATCSTVFAIALFQKGLGIIGGVRATLLSTFEPLVSVMVGVVVFHEALTLRIMCGIALILVSAILLVRAGA